MKQRVGPANFNIECGAQGTLFPHVADDNEAKRWGTGLTMLARGPRRPALFADDWIRDATTYHPAPSLPFSLSILDQFEETLPGS